MADFSFLAEASDIWGEWRFEPWSSGSASGLYRRVSMVKSGLMGEVARYYADDYLSGATTRKTTPSGCAAARSPRATCWSSVSYSCAKRGNII